MVRDALYLPIEVIENILKFLPCLEDRKAASLVCTRWYEAFLNPCFRDEEVVRFVSERDIHSFQLTRYKSLSYKNMEFKDCDITRKIVPLLEEHGQGLKSLKLTRCTVSEKTFTTALTMSKGLQSLSIHDCKDLFMSGIFLDTLKVRRNIQESLVMLRELDFSFNRYISDAVIHTVLKMCPMLDTLNLTGCQISYHHGMYCKFYPSDDSSPSENVTTFPIILKSLNENREKKFKSLTFSQTLMDNDSLLDLALSKQLQIKTFKINQCLQISDRGLTQMCATGNMNTITELDIGGCDKITDVSFLVICTSLLNIRKLSVKGCKKLTDGGMENLSQLTCLTSLNVGECELIKGEGLIKGLEKKTVQELNLHQMINLSEQSVIKLAQNLPQLVSLDLSSCRAVTDASLQAVIQNCVKLQYLNLAYCENLTDSSLTGIDIHEHPQSLDATPLRINLGSRQEVEIRLDAEIKEQVRELCEKSGAVSGESLARIKNLRHLNVRGCTRITDVSLQHAFSHPQLQKLDMSYCQQVSATGLKFLVKRCRNIESLNLDICHNVTNEGVQVLLEGLPRLKSLTLGSDCINSNAVHYFQGSNLAHLDIRHCTKLSGDCLPQLRNLPSLRSFACQEEPFIETKSVQKPPKPPQFKFWKFCSR